MPDWIKQRGFSIARGSNRLLPYCGFLTFLPLAIFARIFPAIAGNGSPQHNLSQQRIAEMSKQADLLTVTQAAQRVPGRPICRTVWRWIEKGSRGHRLAVVRTPGRTYIKPAALEQFIRQLSEQGGRSDG